MALQPDAQNSIRAGELSILDGQLMRARDGSGGAILLVGDPGIGKSYLIEDFLGHAWSANSVVLRIEAPPGPSALPSGRPYAALLEMVNDHWDALESTDADAAGAALARAVRDGAKAREVRRLFDELVARVSAKRPTTVVVADHLGEGDLALLDALAHVARRSRERPVLVVVAMRPSDALLTRFLERSEAFVLPVEPLTDDESRLLLAGLLGDELDAASVEEIVRHAGGNPMFLVELAAARSSADDSPQGRSPAATLSLLLVKRIERLSAPAKQLVRVAAIAIRPTTFRFCALVLGLDPEDRLPLDEAVDSGLLVERADGTIGFPNPLVPELANAATPREQIRQLHERLVQLLLLLGSSPVETAHHALCAAQPGDTLAAEAVGLALEAADIALHGGNPHVVSDLVERALRLDPARDAEARLRTLAAEAVLLAGDAHEAVGLFERALAIATTPEATLGFGRALQRSGRLTAALEVFEHCEGIEAERGRAEVLLGLGHTDEAWKAARAEVENARASGDGVRLASALANAALVEAVRAMPEAVETAEAAVALWRQAGEDSLDWPPLFALGLALESADRFAESLTVLRELRHWLDSRGLMEVVPRVVRTETISAFLSLQWARMEEALAAAMDVKRHAPNHEMGPIWAAAGALAAARADGPGWKRCLEKSSNALDRQSTPFDRALTLWWRGLGHFLRFEMAESRSAFTEAVAGFRAVGATDFLVRTLPIVCGMAAVGGEREAALAYEAEYRQVAAPDARPAIEESMRAIRASLEGDLHDRASALVDMARAYGDGQHGFGCLYTTLAACMLHRAVVPDELVAECLGRCEQLGMSENFLVRLVRQL